MKANGAGRNTVKGKEKRKGTILNDMAEAQVQDERRGRRAEGVVKVRLRRRLKDEGTNYVGEGELQYRMN
jgi:hypothetical protein